MLLSILMERGCVSYCIAQTNRIQLTETHSMEMARLNGCDKCYGYGQGNSTYEDGW